MANRNGVGGFKPGQSGNPSGRPKVNEVIVTLAQACTEDAIDMLAAIMRDESKPTAARVTAAIALLDRGYGKPSQSVTVENPHGTTPLADQIILAMLGMTAPIFEQQKVVDVVPEEKNSDPRPPSNSAEGGLSWGIPPETISICRELGGKQIDVLRHQTKR